MIQQLRLWHMCALVSFTWAQSTFDTPQSPFGDVSNHPTLPNQDAHSGVSDTFNLVLHDPRVALSTPGTQVGISCPAALKWNEQYTKNATEGMTDDEREQAWILSYMDQHPDQTLWELFTTTLDQDVKKWVQGPRPTEKALDNVVEFTADVLKELVLMMWAAFKWIVKFPFEFKKEWKQVKDFGAELWDGTKIAVSLFEDNPMDAFKTITGGLFLHLLLHPSEFTAESILLVGAGFQVMHALLDGVELVAGTLPPLVGNALMSVFWFLHSLDEPLLMITPIFKSTAQALQAKKAGSNISGSTEDNGGFTSADGSNLVSLPPDTVLKASNQCALLPPDLGAPPLTYTSLCLSSDPSRVREIVYGTRKPTKELTREERLLAFNHVQKFWCCYGDNGQDSIPIPDSIFAQIPGRESWEGNGFWKSFPRFDCQKIFQSTLKSATSPL